MCGIAGFWCRASADGDIAERMAARVTSRGPDDAGAWAAVFSFLRSLSGHCGNSMIVG
jgi:asparagine synthetase B (glutamine-hydrolysing)